MQSLTTSRITVDFAFRHFHLLAIFPIHQTVRAQIRGVARAVGLYLEQMQSRDGAPLGELGGPLGRLPRCSYNRTYGDHLNSSVTRMMQSGPLGRVLSPRQ